VRDARITKLRHVDPVVPDLQDIFVLPTELAVIQNGRDGAPPEDGMLVVSAGIGGFTDV